MRFIEIRGGILQPVSNEETLVMEKVRGHGNPLPKTILDDREKELARNLVTRGLLTRIVHEGKICFLANDLEEMWENN